MKRFKKVLALVLAGVLALAMLTACGETADPDSIMPEDGTPEVVMTVNNMAKFLPQNGIGICALRYNQHTTNNTAKAPTSPIVVFALRTHSRSVHSRPVHSR